MVTKLWLALAVGFSWFLSLFCTLLGYWLLAIGYSQAIGVLLLILVFSCLLVIAFCHHSHCLFNHSTTRKANSNRTDFRRSHCKVPRGKKSLENDRYYYRFCIFVVFRRSGTHFSGFGFISQESRNVYFWCNITYSSLLLNSLCNPIIYYWESKKIRKAITGLIIRRENQT